MNEEFVQNIRQAVEERLGEGFRVTLQTVRKNNNVLMKGLIISQEGKNISPTVYLDSYYRDYINGASEEDIVGSIIDAAEKGMPKSLVNLDFFTDFSAMESRICYRLIHAEKNRELLEEIPYIPFLDLAICFFYPFYHEEIGSGSITIRNSHMEKWGGSVQTLWERAERNTEMLYPAQCSPMSTLLMELMGQKQPEEYVGSLPQKKSEGELQMLVLSNRQRMFGAGVVLYKDYLEQLADWFEDSFYILPSSVHEVILLSCRYQGEKGQLKRTIHEVNTTQVECQEVLSDSLYLYDRDAKQIRIAETEI